MKRKNFLNAAKMAGLGLFILTASQGAVIQHYHGTYTAAACPDLIEETWEGAGDGTIFAWDTDPGTPTKQADTGAGGTSTNCGQVPAVGTTEIWVEGLGVAKATLYPHFFFKLVVSTAWTENDNCIIFGLDAATGMCFQIYLTKGAAAYNAHTHYWDGEIVGTAPVDITTAQWWEVKAQHISGGGANWIHCEIRNYTVGGEGGAWTVLADDDTMVEARTPNSCYVGQYEITVTPADAFVRIDRFSLDTAADCRVEE